MFSRRLIKHASSNKRIKQGPGSLFQKIMEERMDDGEQQQQQQQVFLSLGGSSEKVHLPDFQEHYGYFPAQIEDGDIRPMGYPEGVACTLVHSGTINMVNTSSPSPLSHLSTSSMLFSPNLNQSLRCPHPLFTQSPSYSSSSSSSSSMATTPFYS